MRPNAGGASSAFLLHGGPFAAQTGGRAALMVRKMAEKARKMPFYFAKCKKSPYFATN